MKAVFSCIVLICASSLSAQSIETLVERHLSDIIALYKQIHANPELSYNEKQTAERIATELRRAGFTVFERVGKYAHSAFQSYGVVGVLANGPGPTLLIRADMDALPIEEKTGLPYASTRRQLSERGDSVYVMHACGHDIHVATLIGVARLLADLRSQWSGKVILVGQPAEERGAGARALLTDSLYERFGKPDIVLGLHTDAEHPAGTVGLTAGPITASVDMVDVTIRGVGGHGAYPHTTKDPIVMAAEFVMAIQTIVSRQIPPREPAVVTVGSICGGTKHNIIPDEVHLQLTVRTYTESIREQILAAIERIANGIAYAANVPPNRMPIVHRRPEEHTPPQHNDTALVQRLEKVFRRVFGPENVYHAEPTMGGEDFAYYRLGGKIPSCFFRIGAVNPSRYREARVRGEQLPSLHSSQFAPDPEPTLRTALLAMTHAAFELLRIQ
ncbi:MAG: amidohydrolase [Bacteroidota bacterium]|nr:amidohydrolase [Bacteroidota bacterium]